MIQDTYTGSGEFTLAPSILLPVAAFFNAFPTAAKGSLTEGNDQLLKTTSNLFFAPLNGFVYLCLTRSLPFQPAARFQNTRVFFIKFYFI